MGVRVPFSKPLAFAAFRIFAAAAFIYVGFGCIVFPQWWTEFLLGGGVLKLFFWRAAFAYLGSEIRQFSPLAVPLIVGLIALIGHIIFWLGKHSSQGEKTKAAFLERVPPTKKAVVILGGFCSLILVAAALQPGSYSASKTAEIDSRSLEERVSGIMGDFFGPPPSGFYQYLNEKLIIKQYQALQNDMEPKQKTQTIGKEHNASVAVALAGASLAAGSKSSDEHSATFGVPEISAPFAASQLIKRFMTETNVLRWTRFGDCFHPFAFSPDSVSVVNTMLRGTGVELSSQQLAQLKEHARSRMEAVIAQVTPQRVLLYTGSLHFRKAGTDRLLVEFSIDAPIRISFVGRLQKENIADSLLFAFEGHEEGRELVSIRLLAITGDTQKGADGNYQISITPECIW